MIPKSTKGGEFLIKQTSPKDVFTPEDFSEDQRMLRDAISEFVDREIAPQKAEFEKKNYQLTEVLLKKCSELGLLGLSVPVAYGGLGVGFTTTILAADYISGVTGSFATAFGAHTGIGTMPVVLYGTEAQRQKYLPKLASGEYFGAYCLTEPSAGSDANSGKTKAILSEDGKFYTLNGQKMWISNAGFASLFIVFARIDEDKNISCFIVENDPSNGITLGDEEQKLGIRSSSTRQVFFNNTKVPVENMLSERQNGLKIALNVLNIGRIKLAAATLDAQRFAIRQTVSYANQRVQFGVSISKFGAIKAKFADMATALYFCESACYRTAQFIEDAITYKVSQGVSEQEAEIKSIEDYALECSILKIAGSEDLQHCADECIQIFGGMGFSQGMPIESVWRDARITRIYEGTNEINRMLCINLLMKKALRGDLDIIAFAQKAVQDLANPQKEVINIAETLAQEKHLIENFKILLLILFGHLVESYGTELDKHQDLLLAVSDILIQTYLAESGLLRTFKNIERFGADHQNFRIEMVRLGVYKASEIIHSKAREVIISTSEDVKQQMLLTGLKKLITYQKYPNTGAIRTEISAGVLA